MCPACFFLVQVPSPKPWDSMAIPLAGVEELRWAPRFLFVQAGSVDFLENSCLAVASHFYESVGHQCVFDDPVFVEGRLGDDLIPKKCHLATEVVVD